MTSPIASLTTSSKRDMCAPFWRGAEVDEALEPRVEELLVAVLADADDLLDAGHADARERDLHRRAAGLDVGRRDQNAAGRPWKKLGYRPRAARPNRTGFSAITHGGRLEAAPPPSEGHKAQPHRGLSRGRRRSEQLHNGDGRPGTGGVSRSRRKRWLRESKPEALLADEAPIAEIEELRTAHRRGPGARLPDLRGDRAVLEEVEVTKEQVQELHHATWRSTGSTWSARTASPPRSENAEASSRGPRPRERRRPTTRPMPRRSRRST